jgi:hypothetical protein
MIHLGESVKQNFLKYKSDSNMGINDLLTFVDMESGRGLGG